mmetsp:Transcript_19061/g.73359  ORF Transcript_19061/g.73359 Transcript_19061/m.73359 type:complete len:408 (-) Transcript_19061:312-1535(-)
MCICSTPLRRPSAVSLYSLMMGPSLRWRIWSILPASRAPPTVARRFTSESTLMAPVSSWAMRESMAAVLWCSSALALRDLPSFIFVASVCCRVLHSTSSFHIPFSITMPTACVSWSTVMFTSASCRMSPCFAASIPARTTGRSSVDRESIASGCLRVSVFACRAAGSAIISAFACRFVGSAFASAFVCRSAGAAFACHLVDFAFSCCSSGSGCAWRATGSAFVGSAFSCRSSDSSCGCSSACSFGFMRFSFFSRSGTSGFSCAPAVSLSCCLACLGFFSDCSGASRILVVDCFVAIPSVGQAASGPSGSMTSSSSSSPSSWPSVMSSRPVLSFSSRPELSFCPSSFTGAAPCGSSFSFLPPTVTPRVVEPTSTPSRLRFETVSTASCMTWPRMALGELAWRCMTSLQ